MTLPKISCFCCTFGRPQLLEEAIESFLRQDYKGQKELIVLNDYVGHTLHFEHPEVRVINLSERVTPLGKKFNLAASYCSGDILMPWEDDDIYLPWRLRVSVDNMREGIFHTRQAWFEDEAHQLQFSTNLYQCNLAIAKSVWQNAGYLEQDISAIDLALYRTLGGQKISQQLPLEDVFYVYRWQASGSFHASELGGNCEGMSDFFGYKVEQLASIGEVPLGEVQLKPHWKRDYVALARSAAKSFEPQEKSPTSAETLQVIPCIDGIAVGDELLLNIPTKTDWFILDPLAREIWQHAVLGHNTEAIARHLRQRFALNEEYARQDIEGLRASFKDLGLFAAWQQPLWLEINNQIVAIITDNPTLREHLLAVYPHLNTAWPVNWDRVIEVREERDFYSVYVDETLDADLLYADQALYRVIEWLGYMKATTTNHATYVQGMLLSVHSHIIAITGASLDNIRAFIESTKPSDVDILSYSRFEIADDQHVLAVHDPYFLSGHFNANRADKARVATVFAHHQIRHLMAYDGDPQAQSKSYRVEQLYILDTSHNWLLLTPAKTLNHLFSKALVKSNGLSQHKAQILVNWLTNTHTVAINEDTFISLLASTNQLNAKQIVAEPATGKAPISTFAVPQFKRFSKANSLAATFDQLPTPQQRQANTQRFSSINTNPTIELVEWVREQLEAGKGKAQLYRDLLDSGYCMEMTQKAMYGFKPDVKREQIEHAHLRKSTETTPSLYFAFANIAITEDPQSERVADTRAQIYQKQHAFSVDECDGLLQLIKDHFQPSTVVDQVGDSNNGYRTSFTAYLGKISPDEDRRVKTRISQLMGIDAAYLESLQVQRYGEGQEYKVHCDFFHPTSPTFKACVDKVGQRTWTCVLYLNDDFEGGETRFTSLDISVKPQKGLALCWNNLNPLGSTNDWTYHCGEPVKSGYKYIISAWFREKPFTN